MNFKDKYQKYLTLFEKALEDFFNNLKEVPEPLNSAMNYAVKGGGKRVRPVLCLAIADAFNLDLNKVLPHAIAIELIHSYSLVHDDLPSMDNDDYRRGKLSTHKKFGEAIGVLTGDALLNLAFEVVLSKQDFDILDAKALKLLADYSGSNGMIKGQVLDVEGEKDNLLTEQKLYDIVINKTAKLISAPLLISSILAQEKYFDLLKEYGFSLGWLFQITDDIFDVTETLENIGKTPNKDKNKITAVNVYGLENARAKAKDLYHKCLELISDVKEFDFLCEFTDYIYNRKN